DQGPAVVVAGDDGAAEQVERLVHRLVGEVGHVEDHADALHLAEQGGAVLVQAAGFAGAVAVAGVAVVREADDPQAGGPPVGDVGRGENRVGAFHADDGAEGGAFLAPPPLRGRVKVGGRNGRRR